MFDSKVKRTLKCMMIGSLIYNIFLIIVSAIVFILISKNKNFNNNETLIYIFKNEISVLIGFVCSIIGLYSMAASLSKAISSNDEKYAKNHIALMRTIRLIVFCVLLIVIINENVFGISGGIMFALAVLGIKAGAYLVPIVEKHLL
ncbi:MAG: hypothetical protein IKI71_03710 [Lachnospiraceae bacterium]|nr:hypothetical protein [Lachnospiraceae bacterium]